MKRISLILASLVLIAGCNGVKVSKSMLKMALANTDKVSTCTNDFLRSQSLMIKSDRDAAGLQVELLDIESANRNVAHVHNVINPGLPESQKVNGGMIAFMDKILD